MFDKIKNAKYSWVLLALFFSLLSHISRAIRWKMLITPLGYTIRNLPAFFAVMIGYFSNFAFPRMGEIVKCGVLNKYEKVPFNSLVGTIIIERAIDLIFFIILAILTFAFQIKLLGWFFNEHIVSPILYKIENNQSFIILILVILVVAFFLIYFLYKLIYPKIRKSIYFYKLKRLIIGFSAGLKTIKRMKNRGVFIVHTFFIWIMYFLMTYVCFFALNETSGLDLKAGVSILVMGSIGIIIPVPGGIGTFHSIVKISLEQIYHIVPTATNAFVIIVHSSQMFFIVFLGLISLILLPLIFKTKRAI